MTRRRFRGFWRCGYPDMFRVPPSKGDDDASDRSRSGASVPIWGAEREERPIGTGVVDAAGKGGTGEQA
jgi:hypothetical protein